MREAKSMYRVLMRTAQQFSDSAYRYVFLKSRGSHIQQIDSRSCTEPGSLSSVSNISYNKVIHCVRYTPQLSAATYPGAARPENF